MSRILKARIDARIKTGEKTQPQVSYVFSQQELWPQLPKNVTYDTYRELRLDPTIALARALVVGTVLAGRWSISADEDIDDAIVEFIYQNMQKMRPTIMENAICSIVDFGWQSFEKVFEAEKGKIRLRKIKPLLHEMTLLLIDEKTGEFVGVKQTPLGGEEIYLDKSKIFLCNYNVEGTYWYGRPLLENVRKTQKLWEQANLSASAYDKKVAGSHFVIYYPPGISEIGGEQKSNADIAITLLSALENSGSIAVPRSVNEWVDELNNQTEMGWKIELLEDSGGRQPTFIDRLKYLDVLKVRGLLLPERSVLEGQFGTKAEAGVHSDIAFSNVQLMDFKITREVNEQIVDQLLAINFGLDFVGKVRLVPTPLQDNEERFLRATYTQILNNPEGFLEEFATIDTDAIKDKLSIPKIADVAQHQHSQREEKPKAGTSGDDLEAVEGLSFSQKLVSVMKNEYQKKG